MSGELETVERHSVTVTWSGNGDEAGRPHADVRFLSHARGLSNDELLETLQEVAPAIDQDGFRKMTTRSLSVSGLLKALEEAGDETADKPRRRLQLCVMAAWERWIPERPPLERLEEDIEVGYSLSRSDQSVEACDLWLAAWKASCEVMAVLGNKSLETFGGLFEDKGFVQKWLKDLATEMHNASFLDQGYRWKRAQFCLEVLEGYICPGPIVRELRIALADAYLNLGEPERVDALYSKWLDEDPSWGLGWIGWSDCYWFWGGPFENRRKAERILSRGVAVETLRDRRAVLLRLATLYKEMRRTRDLRDVYKQLRVLSRTATAQAQEARSSSCVRLNEPIRSSKENRS